MWKQEKTSNARTITNIKPVLDLGYGKMYLSRENLLCFHFQLFVSLERLSFEAYNKIHGNWAKIIFIQHTIHIHPMAALLAAINAAAAFPVGGSAKTPPPTSSSSASSSSSSTSSSIRFSFNLTFLKLTTFLPPFLYLTSYMAPPWSDCVGERMDGLT